MKNLIVCAAIVLAVAVLAIGSAATAKPPVKKDAKTEKATSAEAEKPQDKAAEKPAEAEKATPDAKPSEEKPADAKPAPEKPAAEKPAAEKPAAEAKPAEEKKPATHAVSRGLVKVELSVKGVFEGRKSVPVSVSPDEWKMLLVKDGVKHGAKVAKGDVLIRFDTEDLDKAIDDQRTSLRLAELGLKQAEKSLAAIEETAPLDLALMDRAKRNAEQDQDRYFEIDRPMSQKSADYSLKSYEEMLEYEQEELRQLEKMYEADDLTEETEEIILKRQRQTVQRAEFMLELARLRHEETLKINLPRTDESIRDQTVRQGVATETAKITIPVSLSRQRIEVEKMKVDLARNKDRLEELLADREKLTVRAPIDGVVYYGKYVRGSWSGGTTMADAMRPGGKVNPEDVFMTVVEPRPLLAQVTVPEGDLHWVRPGLKGIVQPSAFPDLQIDGVVTEVESVPLASGSFLAAMKVKTLDEALMPGMALTAKFIPYAQPRALTVPAKAVFTEDLNPRKRYVYLAPDDGKPKKQAVTVGRKSGENLEILDGLTAGDKVLLEKPKEG